MKLYNDKCENVLCQFEADSIEAMVTDPPAGIAFMGKDWDNFTGKKPPSQKLSPAQINTTKGGNAFKQHAGRISDRQTKECRDNFIAYMTGIFEQCLRVLKPGAWGLVWALPRTSHWTATALENAGFKVRDICHYLFGSGFPKSLNIGKAVDRLQGNEREIIGNNPNYRPVSGKLGYLGESNFRQTDGMEISTKGSSEWEGWGTALKPACEHWILVRKPLGEKTVAANVLAYGVGGINVDGCRIGNGDDKIKGGCINRKEKPDSAVKWGIGNQEIKDRCYSQGRFPANVIHDGSETVLAGFPNTKSGKPCGKRNATTGFSSGIKSGLYDLSGFGDEGSASRFFYCAKASKSDRDEGLEGFEEKEFSSRDKQDHFATICGKHKCQRAICGCQYVQKVRNNHPTVKSTELMRYLCRLITPPGGTVLDPFMGSGSTGKGAILEGFDFIGIEQDAEYFKIAEARINFVLNKEEKQVRLAI